MITKNENRVAMPGSRIRLVTASKGDPSIEAARLGSDFTMVHEWLREYISKPAEVGRNGPVCPFVPPALREYAIEFVFRYDVDATDDDVTRAALLDELVEFDATATPISKAGSSLASRLIIMPLADREGWRRIDRIYESMKDHAVRAHLMIGQFHPDCDERAIRNDAFPVSRSPLALVAVRRMAPHDVLFLHDRKPWFNHYREKFRTHIERGKIRDALMLELYANAVAAHEEIGDLR